MSYQNLNCNACAVPDRCAIGEDVLNSALAFSNRTMGFALMAALRVLLRLKDGGFHDRRQAGELYQRGKHSGLFPNGLLFDSQILNFSEKRPAGES